MGRPRQWESTRCPWLSCHFPKGLQWEPILLASWEVFGMSFVIYVLCRPLCAYQMFTEQM